MNDQNNNVINEQPNIQNKTPEMLLPQMYQPKPLFELAKGDTAFAICSAVVSIFMAIFGIFGGFALGYLISFVLIAALFTVYFAKQGKINAFSITGGLLSLGNAAVFICTTNGSVRFFAVIISFLLLLVSFNGVINGATIGNRNTFGVFYSAASTVSNVAVSLKSLFSGRDGQKKTAGKVMIGLACAVPVLVVVVPLLISSDDAFKGLIENIFSNTFENILKAVFGILLSFFVISYGFSLKTGRISKIKESKFAGIESVYIIAFLSAIGVCYLLYLFSQLAYFFSAFGGFLPEDYSYSEYARKGFFQMCVIAVINLGIIFLAIFLSKKPNGKVCHGIKALTTFIAVFTLVIISTAISKMVLYINEYGMTVLRITTSAFMLFLAALVITVILRIYIVKINIVKTALIAAGVVVMLLGVSNVNAVCAKYNYDNFINGKLKSIDVEAMYNLGDEGIPYITQLAYSENGVISREAKECLAQAYIYDYFDGTGYDAQDFSIDDLTKNQKDKGFERFSIPKAAAYSELYEYIEKNTDFSVWCRQNFINEEVMYNW